jgi:NAD(P)-dependent dehydrogenase (short-subunit alcohol dehydrogenase family)
VLGRRCFLNKTQRKRSDSRAGNLSYNFFYFSSINIQVFMYNQPMLRPEAMQGKTIIVTGGGTGLGRSMAKYFLELGANVIITSRKMDVLEKTAAELEALTGGQVLAHAGDARNYDDVERVLAAAVARFGKVDGLVNNAAGNFISPTEKLSHKGFDVVVDIVLKGTYNYTLALGKYWIAEGIKGTVMNIVTTYAWTGSGYVVPSAAAKAGVLAITRSLAVEWGAKYGIRMNAIAPGPFPTEGAWERLFPAEAMGAELAAKLSPEHRVPLKRVGDHQELANLAAFLMSDFSSYINGEVITIDGGEWLMGAGEFSDLNEVSEEKWEAIARAVRGKK